MEIDARGLRCPWPVLRAARAMREAGEGAELRILVDDPAAPAELAALAAARGWHCTPIEAADGRGFSLRSPSGASTDYLPCRC